MLTESAAWSCFVTPLYSMPAALPVTADTMNYASPVFVGFVVISIGWYLVYGRKHYTGPPAKEEEVARRRSSIISG